jgi:hypothetical protein
MWAANLDTAILDQDGKFTGRYRTRSIKIFQVVRPTHFLQFDFQFGRAGSFDGTNLLCSVLDKNLDPLKFDFHVQETTKSGDEPLRSFRVFFLFDQVLTPDSVDQPYRAEYQFEGDDPYPNLGVGLEGSTITMRQGGADQAILCVAFPRAKVKGRLQIVDIVRVTPEQLRQAKYTTENERFVPSEEMQLYEFVESMALGNHPPARYVLVGRRVLRVEQKQTFGFLIGHDQTEAS